MEMLGVKKKSPKSRFVVIVILTMEVKLGCWRLANFGPK